MRCTRICQRAGLPRLGRPRRDVPNRPTACPLGHQGGVILWGTREWTSAPFRRQRFRCEPPDGSTAHTFSLGRRRASGRHPAGEECVTCDVRPGVAEGPISPVGHLHTAVEIAHLLQLVGEGMSLRSASRTVRLEAHRFVEDRHGMRHASRQHTLAARYLDLFGRAVDARLAPTRCPRILILDSKPLNLRAYGAEGSDPTWHRDERGGAVFVAIGGDDPGGRYLPWRIGLAPDETTTSWRDFLDEIDPGGEGPEWVVADGSKAIAMAVLRRWPRANLYACEFHLGRALREAAGADGIWPDAPDHATLFERAFWSEPDWDALGRFIAGRGANSLSSWWRTNDALVRQQAALRRRFRRYPRSNAAAERILDWIDRRFGRGRRYGLRNAQRLQLVLALIRAHHAGQADLATLATIVKRELRELPASPRFAWTALHDPRTRPCSIAQLVIDAHDRAARGTATYMAAAKARSVLANVAAQQAELAALGQPPLLATIAPGRRTASVKVRGMLLARDFPLVARDWDAAANSVPLASLQAGSGYRAHWACHRCGHRWEAEVAQRTMRQTRCERCSTERADGRSSLAALHPELVREWDTSANGPLRPARIKATYDRTVAWRCPADPAHPGYRMSPFTRARRDVGCPLCRKKRARSATAVVEQAA